MAVISNHLDYRGFLRELLHEMPKRGHGQLAKIARHLDVHPTLLTQILNEQKKLNLEHGLLICEYFGLSTAETDFFLALIDLEKAGHHKLKKRVKERIDTLKSEMNKAQAQIPAHSVLSEADSALFYSNWYYSAVRLLVGIKGYNTVDSIAQKLDLERKLVKEILDFLSTRGLVRSLKDGQFAEGPQRTYVPSHSPLVGRHHTNWRLKAIENYHRLTSDELAFTAPITLSLADVQKVKQVLLKTIEELSRLVDKSEQETLACLSLDFFTIR